MITLEQYFGQWHNIPDFTPARLDNARLHLLPACSALEKLARLDGVIFPLSPLTLSGVSGRTYGGFRPQNCPQGAKNSLHKEALAVDRYDPMDAIDAWCTAHLDLLEKCGIWIESPVHTTGWSHWQCVAPPSGHRVFLP